MTWISIAPGNPPRNPAPPIQENGTSRSGQPGETTGRDRAVAEQPARRPEPDLVSALVEEPAVVVHTGRERDEREPVDHEQRDEQAPRLAKRNAVPHPHGRAPDAARSYGADACSRYQAIVRSEAGARLVRTKPKRSAAFVVSSNRLGWPFGFDVSQLISPS